LANCHRKFNSNDNICVDDASKNKVLLFQKVGRVDWR